MKAVADGVILPLHTGSKWAHSNLNVAEIDSYCAAVGTSNVRTDYYHDYQA